MMVPPYIRRGFGFWTTSPPDRWVAHPAVHCHSSINATMPSTGKGNFPMPIAAIVAEQCGLHAY